MTKMKGSKPPKDPNYAHEKEKYQNPIASREFILQTIERAKKPLTKKELSKLFKLKGEDKTSALKHRLFAMVRDGQLVQTPEGYSLPSMLDSVVGIVHIQNSGSGLVTVENSDKGPVFLSFKETHRLWSGDRVEVRITGFENFKSQGIVTKILDPQTPNVVVQVQRTENGLYGLPLHSHLKSPVFIDTELPLKQNERVVVRLDRDTKGRVLNEGECIERLQSHGVRETAIAIAVTEYNLPDKFPEEVEKAANKFGDKIPEKNDNRTDCSNLAFVTIDGEDAKDFDDAVYCEQTAQGFTLYVAIADVAHYVTAGSVLDKEARDRGTSVYFPGTCIPMLPEALSNGLCSLNPHVPRLVMVAQMEITKTGQVFKTQFYNGIINSRARLTYTQVANALDGDRKTRDDLAEVFPHLQTLDTLFGVLLKARHKRGALDFETIESRFSFNEEGSVESVAPVQRNKAHKIIEECMLLANVSVAEFLYQQRQPCLYRNHKGPLGDKLTLLRQFLTTKGLILKGGIAPTPLDYAHVIEQAVDRPDKAIIHMSLLRSLTQAVYAPECEGHFGLSFEKYLHFTSPIRRYPDLVVHRALKAQLARPQVHADLDPDIAMENLGEHCSMTERRAEEASREVDMALKCSWAAHHIGTAFLGRISAVTNFGLFVTIEELYLDGLVHITALGDDYYEYDPGANQLVGRHYGEVFDVGAQLMVRIARVDEIEHKIDLELVQNEDEQEEKVVKKKKRKRDK